MQTGQCEGRATWAHPEPVATPKARALPAHRGTFLGKQPGLHLGPEGLTPTGSCIKEAVYRSPKRSPEHQGQERLLTPSHS